MVNLVRVNRQIISDIKQELRLQGHYLTGELESSFQDRELVEQRGIVIEAYAYAFLKDLEEGVEANDIPEFNKNSDEFRNLVRWVKLRGLENSGRYFMSAESIAEAIWRRWQKEGKPLEGAKKFSSTGTVLGAVTETFYRNEDKYFKDIDDEVIKEMDLYFENSNVVFDKFLKNL